MAIKRLSRDAIERISAGEVVERPASVVKELLENALDAGAAQVAVDVGGDGPDTIMVRDDGCGIPPGEMELALERHATSKISGAEDLWRISTYGFRGEALAAIASISRLTLASRVKGGAGHAVTGEGGVVGKAKPASVPEGTTVKVEKLFYNTPARRKFMKTQRTEVAAVVRAVSDASLARPDVAFTLSHEGRTLLELPAPSDPRARLALLMSHDEAKRMIHASGAVGEVAVDAYLSPPEHSRATSGKLTLLVNGRPVASKAIFAGVMAGYGGRLLRGRYPVGFVSVTVPPATLDVNVSPTKSQVKFGDEHAVSSAVARTVKSAMEKAASAPDASSAGALRGAGTQRDFSGGQAVGAGARPAPIGAGTQPAPIGAGSAALSPAAQLRLRRFGATASAIRAQTHLVPPGGGAQATGTIWPARILGQAFDSYIVAEAGGAVILVDQHAADERINFERMSSAFKAGVPTQRLLEPVVVSLGAADMAALSDNIDTLHLLGFSIEPFGPREAKVEGVPVVLGRLAGGAELRAALDELVTEGLLRGGASFLDRAVKMVACKASVKANEPLSEDEMERILRELQACGNPLNCPHGRPTHIRLQKGRLERDFLRAV